MGRGPKFIRDRHMGDWVWSSANFWSKVDQSAGENACWQWLGSMTATGGLFGGWRPQADGSVLPQMSQARRFMYAETHGVWPEQRRSIYHSCGNRNCINPRHFTDIRPDRQEYKLLPVVNPIKKMLEDSSGESNEVN